MLKDAEILFVNTGVGEGMVCDFSVMFPHDVRQTQLIPLGEMNDLFCPVVHKLNDCRVVMTSVENIRLVQAVVGGKPFVAVLFYLLFSQDGINHSELQYALILFIQAIQRKMGGNKKILLSPLNFLEQPRR